MCTGADKAAADNDVVKVLNTGQGHAVLVETRLLQRLSFDSVSTYSVVNRALRVAKVERYNYLSEILIILEKEIIHFTIFLPGDDAAFKVLNPCSKIGHLLA